MSAAVQRSPPSYQFESTFSIVNPSTSGSDKSKSGSPTETHPAQPPPRPSQAESQEKPKAHDVGFSFVNVINPHEGRGSTNKRAIRSHVARVQHSRVRIASAVTKKTAKAKVQARNLQPRPIQRSNVAGPLRPAQDESPEDEAMEEVISPAISGNSRRTQRQTNAGFKRHDSMINTTSDVDALAEDLADFLTFSERETPHPVVQQKMFLRVLSGDRSVMTSKQDPFWSYPIDYHPSYERVIDYYVVNIAVDMDFLTPPGQEGNMKKQWIPLTMTDPAAFYAITLMAATAYSYLDTKLAHAINLMHLKGKALAAINEALSDPKRATNDATVAGILKMASYEAAFGNTDFFHSHMNGLEQIIRMRGGFDNLGWDGLLERMIIWVDTNASHALGCGWKFDDDKWKPSLDHPAPDPLRFARCVS
ncbi:fungal specific transcription factor domain-containing protein 60 [Elsinoe australis]|uniref:Fungal specific transcription factor domain-containing protein 60 n=1 Tax=Elsinoe australis TaxID=40998 RepID=A0A4U7ANV1_9PEZI|nr:fungal specific transcription factor domain-containing protein 60 [Elsinoe australis]